MPIMNHYHGHSIVSEPGRHEVFKGTASVGVFAKLSEAIQAAKHPTKKPTVKPKVEE